MNDQQKAVVIAFAEYATASFDNLVRQIQTYNASAPAATILDPRQLIIYRGELRRLLVDLRSGKVSAAEFRKRLQKELAEHEARRGQNVEPIK